LSDEDVRRYGKDFVDRLIRLDSIGAAPRNWCCLGLSGDKMAAAIEDLIEPGPYKESLELGRLGYDRKTGEIYWRTQGGRQPISDDEVRGKSILLIDGAVHSGRSMADCARKLQKLGAKDLMSYTLVLKKNSQFVPNYFALLLSEHDRPYFQLDVIPNNRLRHRPPFGQLRILQQADADDKQDWLRTGVPSIDRITRCDLIYELNKGNQVFVYVVDGEIVGFIQFHIARESPEVLEIYVVAVHEKVRGAGFGNPMIRWACTYARASQCAYVRLDAHQVQVQKYCDLGFGRTGQPPIDMGNGEVYFPMQKRIIYLASPLKDEPWSSSA
jgi:GNAT superfamily N-acetyltransferase